MKHLKFTGTNHSPTVDFNAQTGVLNLKGHWLPFVDNENDLTDHLFKWLTNYEKSPKEKTVFNVQMDFYSTVAAKYLYQIFMLFDRMHEAGNDIAINWFYSEDDDEMYESGLDYQMLMVVPFWVKPIK